MSRRKIDTGEASTPKARKIHRPRIKIKVDNLQTDIFGNYNEDCRLCDGIKTEKFCDKIQASGRCKIQ